MPRHPYLGVVNSPSETMGLFEVLQLKKTKCLQISKENAGLAFWQSLAFTITTPLVFEVLSMISLCD